MLATACQAPPGPNSAPPAELSAGEPLAYKLAAKPADPPLPNAQFRGLKHRDQKDVPPQAPPRFKLTQVSGGPVVSTFAGPGAAVATCYPNFGCLLPSGYVDGAGADARFSRPWGIAFDPAGNLAVADVNNHNVRRVNPSGVVSTWAGRPRPYGYLDGAADVAQFETPWGVATDAAGHVYVADHYNWGIRRIAPDGFVTTLAGCFLDADGRLQDGLLDGVGRQAMFSDLGSISTLPNGDLLVADAGNHAIRKVTLAGVVTTIAGGHGRGLVDGPVATATFNFPIDTATDAAGNLYVADYDNHAIRKVTPAGIVSTIAGGTGPGFADGPGHLAKFIYPAGIVADACGNLYVADEQNARVRKIDPAGVVTTLFGDGYHGLTDGPAATAQTSFPEGIRFDRNGNLYVSEYFGNRIRKVTMPPGATCGGTQALKGAEPNAFSPNGDGSKDTYALEVTASGDWTISVDGHPGTINTGPGPNTGNKAFSWDGKVNGITLNDGKYTLRLKAGAEEKTVEVTIDRTPPKIESSLIQEIRYEDKEIEFESDIESINCIYKFKAKAGDGIAPASAIGLARLMAPNAPPVVGSGASARWLRVA